MTEVNENAPVTAKFIPEVRNGQAERTPGTRGHQAWSICDAITARKGSTASSAEVVAEGVGIGMNPGQLRAAYAKWRKFHGLAGTRIDNPEKAAAKAAKAEAKAARDAEKIAKAEAKAAEKVAKAEAKAAAAEAKAAEKIAKAEAKAIEKQAAAEAKAAATPPEQPE